MRNTLKITNVTDNQDGTLTLEFDAGPAITRTTQEWQDEINTCYNNYTIPMLRALIVDAYLSSGTVPVEAIIDTTAPSNIWIEKRG